MPTSVATRMATAYQAERERHESSGRLRRRAEQQVCSFVFLSVPLVFPSVPWCPLAIVAVPAVVSLCPGVRPRCHGFQACACCPKSRQSPATKSRVCSEKESTNLRLQAAKAEELRMRKLESIAARREAKEKVRRLPRLGVLFERCWVLVFLRVCPLLAGGSRGVQSNAFPPMFRGCFGAVSGEPRQHGFV